MKDGEKERRGGKEERLKVMIKARRGRAQRDENEGRRKRRKKKGR
jgi:hypothetical protein